MNEDDMQITSLIKASEEHIPSGHTQPICMDCGGVIPIGAFGAPRLDGVTTEGGEISDLICLPCFTMGATFAVISVLRPDEE